MTVHIAHLHIRRLGVRSAVAAYGPSFILAGYGAFILSLQVRGVITLYINPSYVWPTTVAGIGLIFLAVARLFRQSGDDCEACECETAPTRFWPYLVLALPLLLAVLAQPQSLAAFSALQRGTQVAGMTTINGAAPVKRVSLSVDTRSLSLQDWAGALSADPNPKDYAGKPVHITGMVLHNPAMVPPGTIMVILYQVTCCIADARAIGMIVKDTSHGALQDNTWVTVTGTMGSMSYQDQQVAVVQPSSVVRVKSGNPYIY